MIPRSRVRWKLVNFILLRVKCWGAQGRKKAEKGVMKGKKEKRAGECVRAAKEKYFQLQLTTGKWAEAICRPNLLWCSFASRRRLPHQWQRRLQWGGALLWGGKIFQSEHHCRSCWREERQAKIWREGRNGGSRARGRSKGARTVGEERKKAIKQMQRGQGRGAERRDDNNRRMVNKNVDKPDRSQRQNGDNLLCFNCDTNWEINISLTDNEQETGLTVDVALRICSKQKEYSSFSYIIHKITPMIFFE